MIDLTVFNFLLLVLGSIVGAYSAYRIPQSITDGDFEAFKVAGLGILFQECSVAHVVLDDWRLTLVFVSIVATTTAVGFQYGKKVLFSKS